MRLVIELLYWSQDRFELLEKASFIILFASSLSLEIGGRKDGMLLILFFRPGSVFIPSLLNKSPTFRSPFTN